MLCFWPGYVPGPQQCSIEMAYGYPLCLAYAPCTRLPTTLPVFWKKLVGYIGTRPTLTVRPERSNSVPKPRASREWQCENLVLTYGTFVLVLKGVTKTLCWHRYVPVPSPSNGSRPTQAPGSRGHSHHTCRKSLIVAVSFPL